MPAVQAQADALLTLATAQGFPQYVGYGTFWRGWALARQGQREAGLAQMHQGLDALVAMGQYRSATALSRLARRGHRARRRRGGGAAPAGRGPGGVCEPAGGAMCWRRRTGSRASCSSRPGAVPAGGTQAEACFQQALAIARRQQAKSWELRAATSLSRLWQQQGKQAEAHALLAPVYGWFTEGFDTADLQEAQALLEALPVRGSIACQS